MSADQVVTEPTRGGSIPAPGGGTPPRARRSRPLGRTLAPYLFVLPNMVVFTIFTIIPALWMFYIALFDSRDGQLFEFVGLENFAEISTDDEFLGVLTHTAIFTIGFVVLTIVFSTLFAVLLNDRFRGRTFFRAVLFLPSLLSAVVIGLLWGWMFERSNGLVNVALGNFGIGEIPWLVDENLALGVVIFVGLWMHTGFYTLIVLAGLQGIDPNVYEAAKVDGASATQRFFQITWPLLRPTTLVVLILSTIAGFQSFDFIWTLTGGGPVGATTLIVQYIYEKAFSTPIRYGLGAAGGVVLFFIVFALTMANFAYGRRKDAA
ncbi:sugar ABC transporter permease [Enemella evansiae]|uniref:carbohydrate ABC transporter permease n=1 Tax=Enemella evansiae TaxID=2016499 RepID=UPI000B9708D0|nr:sugar ABC transporter permease [Enemella evansiae]OYO13731.1 sugar ABC transporter permease [Enemella evansiae]OYO17047.1 sugar ABC transporter permease [Enemella evansiae]